MRIYFRNLSSSIKDTKISDLGDKIISILALSGLSAIGINTYYEKPTMEDPKKK